MSKLIRAFSIAIVSIAFLTLGNLSVFGETKVTTVGDASYQVTQNITNEDLFYGIKHYKDKASTYVTTDKPQSVNVLEIPSSKDLRIINYTYQNKNGWTKQTVKNMAKNFELNNPGWIVLAGVNGDFFDIEGKKDLAYQTGGVCVENGRVLRPLTGGEATLGFTNNGTTNSIIGGKDFTVDSLKLQIINDETEEVVKSYSIDKLNTAPVGDEISVYYTYPYKEGASTSYYIPKLPEGNNYFVKAPIRSLGISTKTLYANGLVSDLNYTEDVRYGQFAICSNNKALASDLLVGTHIVVEQPVTGDYKDCENITGCGAELLKDGAQGSYPANNADVHPRTMIGKKADGTIQFFTVDGRQPEKEMSGMRYSELAACMKYYDCVEGYNMDGGGSTTMIIRDSEGEFNVVNSPSDGSERHDSNSIFVVVPSVTLNIDSVEDTKAKFSYVLGKNMSVTDLKLSLDNGKTYEFASNELTVTGLDCKTRYSGTYACKVVYKGVEIESLAHEIRFSTGKNAPKVEDAYYQVEDGKYVLHYKLVDPDATTTLLSLKVNGDTIFIDNLNNTSYVLSGYPVTSDLDLMIKINYDLSSSPNETRQMEINIEKKVEEPITPPTEEKKGCKKSLSSSAMMFVTTALLCICIIKRKDN